MSSEGSFPNTVRVSTQKQVREHILDVVLQTKVLSGGAHFSFHNLKKKCICEV